MVASWWRWLKSRLGFRTLIVSYYLKPTPEKPNGERVLVVGNEIMRWEE